MRAQEAEQRDRQQSLEAARGDNTRALAEATEQLAALEEALREAREALPVADDNHRAAQALLAQAQEVLTQAEQQLRLEDTRKGHTEKLLLQLASRRARLEEERDGLEIPNLSELVRLESEIRELDHQLAGQRDAFEQCEAALPQLEQALQTAEETAEQTQQRVHQLDARLTALQSLQEQVSRSGELEPWLDRNDLRRNAHLWQGIRIREGWEDALEAVLRDRLNSIGLADLGQAHGWLAEPPPGKVSFHRVIAGSPVDEPAPAGLERLTDYVTCTDVRLAGVLADWLARVYVLADPAHGIEVAGKLPLGAMLVSAQGHVFTPTSVSFHAADSEVHGILSRQREIEALFAEHTTFDAELGGQNRAVTSRKIEFEERRADADRLRRQVSDLQETQHQLKLGHVRLSQLAERLKARGEQIIRELAEIEAESARESTQQEEAGRQMEALGAGMVTMHAGVEDARQAHAQAETVLQASRTLAQQAERQHQEALYQQKTINNKIIDIDSSLQVLSQTLSRLQSDAQGLMQEVSRTDETQLQEQLQQQLALRGEREQALKQAREELESADQTLRTTEQERLVSEQKLAPARERISELRLKEQEALAGESLPASWAGGGRPTKKNCCRCSRRAYRASRLRAGEINRLNEDMAALALSISPALTNCRASRSARLLLTAQSQDLTEAVEIPGECHSGGSTAGPASACRRPSIRSTAFRGDVPGAVRRRQCLSQADRRGDSRRRRAGHCPAAGQEENSSIHLLSGGEKALTALSLVFALFQLNPAPFCLLDEVDAPLDDTNTERFCELVKKMSANSQFLFISHNKITMEIANQLIGITMQEAGVSRVVAVDVEEALRMREEAAA